MRRFVPLLPMLALAACAAGGDRAATAQSQAGLDRALAGLTPGPATSCIPMSRPNLSTRAYGATLLYKMGNGEVFRNDTAGGCENAARGDILVTVEYEGRPCQGDIIRTVDPVIKTTTGSCALGAFIPYRKAAR